MYFMRLKPLWMLLWAVLIVQNFRKSTAKDMIEVDGMMFERTVNNESDAMVIKAFNPIELNLIFL